MIEIDLSRPDYLYAVIWTVTPLLAYEDLYYMGFDSSLKVTALIASNIVSFFGVYQLIKRKISFFPKDAKTGIADISAEKLNRINRCLFAAWLLLWLLIIYLSGGIPMFWRYCRANKSYVDFGVSTLSGFSNMIRNFTFSFSILLYLNHKNRSSLLIGLFLFLSSLMEMARANATFLILFGLAILLLHKKTKLKTLGVFMLLALIYIFCFGIAEKYRSPNGSGGEEILKYKSILNKLPYGFTDVYLYLSTPVANLYYAHARGISPLGYPYYTLQSIVPTIVRDKIYHPHEYPLALRRKSSNATTFYSPFVADFGLLGAFLLVVPIQIIISYVHVRAKRRDFFYQLIYAPLFASTALSFFFNYFLILGVLLFPFLVLLVRYMAAPPANSSEFA